MDILTKIVFLVPMGFLHFRLSAGIPYPGDKIFVTMNDGCTYDENFELTRHVREWLRPDQINAAPPGYMECYIRKKSIEYKALFTRRPVPPTHNPLHHTPRSVIIHDNLFFLSEHHFIENTFEVYNPEHHASWFPDPTSPKPARGYIYITVPGAHKYRARLPRPTFGKDKRKVRDFPPEISGPQSPETSPPHPHHGASSSGVASTS